MRKRSLAIYALNLALFILFFHLPALAQVSVTTQHNDLNRTGDNLSETVLTKSNVNSTSFGLLYKIPVDNQVYAQPLVVSGLNIGGGTHNVVYIATTSNSVYAFDADSGAQYWHVNLGTPIINTNYSTSCPDINGSAGIIGTPVIDMANNTIYVVNSLNNPSGTYSFQLHALSLTTGADNSGSPVQITASGFVATAQNQRAALLLANGNLYVPFSSHCDLGTYHGYLISYNATTLAQNAVFNTSPSGNGDSLWASGQGPAVDSSGNIYFGTSNGTWDGVSNFSESFIKLSSTLALEDWFTAANHASLDSGDKDLDTSGPLLIPGSTRLFMVGKSGTGYVINSADLGHLGDASAVQTVVLGDSLHGSPTYFDSAVNGPEVYTLASGDHLKAFQYNGNDLNTPNFQTGPDTANDPGGNISVSANGTSNGIVWVNAVLSGSGTQVSVPGVLRAYDADNIATELYNNQQNASRDSCDNFGKNSYPTIANGMVYLGSFGTANAGSGQLCIYGLLNVTCSAPTAPSGLSGSAVSAGQVSLTWTAGSSTCAATYTIFRSTTSGFTPSVANQIAGGVGTTSYTDDTAGAGTTYYYLVEEVNGGGASGPSNQASATTPALGSELLAIDSGSTAAVSPFVADKEFTGGGTIDHANTIDLSHVSNPAPAAVYQTARDGNFTYTIPGFTAGTNYLVRLHFCETFFSTAGSRVGNVSINGTPVLTNFDIFAASGAENRAIIEQFLEPANSSGDFVIVFTSVVNNSLVSGIEIDSTSGGSCSAAPTAPSGLTATAASSSQINLSWTASTAGTGCSITYNVYGSTTSGFTPSSSNQIATGVTTTTYSNTGLAASTTYYYLVEAVDSFGSSAASNQASATTSAPSGSCTSICIDSGSTTTVSPFVADEDFSGGATLNHANTINTSKVTNPAPAAVYQTARDENFTYTIGGFTANSSHTVRLHFCETYFTASGKRTFNVSINSTQVLTDFDIFATAGGQNIANIQQFTEAANSSGQYVIQFTSVVNNSLVSGIEID
ncbi:MAG: malectin domain-containing carbohydrate-binding protein [Candidatus Acidiferrales bacterium]